MPFWTVEYIAYWSLQKNTDWSVSTRCIFCLQSHMHLLESTCAALQQGESWSQWINRSRCERGSSSTSVVLQQNKRRLSDLHHFPPAVWRVACGELAAGTAGARSRVTYVGLQRCLSLPLVFLPVWSVLTHWAIRRGKKTNCTAISQAKLPILTLRVCETKCVTTHCCWHSVMSTWDQTVNPGATVFPSST